MASHNLARIEIDNLEIIGYSVAGEETVVAMPQLDVCFDVGKAPDQIIPVNNVLLTHGHMDHLDPETVKGYQSAGGNGPYLAPCETVAKLQKLNPKVLMRIKPL